MANFKLREEFFTRDDIHKIAEELLGKILVRKHSNGRIQAGIIVEDEVYYGFEDKASHASKSRTKRNEIMFGKGGHYYIYFIYGMYWNLNIVTGKKEFPSAILVRALEPIYDSKIDLKKLDYKEKIKLSSGPGKLCRWMGIDKRFYGKSVEDEGLFITEVKAFNDVIPACHAPELRFMAKAGIHLNRFLNKSGITIQKTKRIGVSYAGDSAYLDWRYYIKGNLFVSKK